MLGSVERLAYDLYADTQLHRGVLDLSHYRVLVLGPHPEYWTRKMYDRVKAWVFEQGGRLMYLGGNGLNCEVELRDDDTMIVHNGVIRSLWPDGIGAESRFARRHESEAKLLGVVFTPSGVMTGAPYRVVDANHWAFAETGLRQGQLSASAHYICDVRAARPATRRTSDLPVRRRRCISWPRARTPTTAARRWLSSTRLAAERSSRLVRFRTVVRYLWTITFRESRPMCLDAFWGKCIRKKGGLARQDAVPAPIFSAHDTSR